MILIMLQLDMDMPDVLTATKGYLDQLSEDDAFEVPTSLRDGIEKAAAESREELACMLSSHACIIGYMLIAY